MNKTISAKLILDSGRTFNVSLTEEEFNKIAKSVPLSTLKPGDVFSTGKRSWVVLDQGEQGTKVMLNDIFGFSKFDDASNDWDSSHIRNRLIVDFLPRVEAEVNPDNIIAHKPDLSTDDGSDARSAEALWDKVSLISCNEYRKYRKFIPLAEYWYWTLTPVSTTHALTGVRFVSSYGVLMDSDCDCGSGAIRPCCVFNPNIEVIKEN